MTFTLNVCLRGLLNCRKLMFVFVAFWTAGKEYTKRRWTGGTNICSLITNIYSVHKMPCWPCNNFRYFWPILIKNKYCRAYRLGRYTCIIRRPSSCTDPILIFFPLERGGGYTEYEYFLSNHIKSCLKSILYKIMSY